MGIYTARRVYHSVVPRLKMNLYPALDSGGDFGYIRGDSKKYSLTTKKGGS